MTVESDKILLFYVIVLNPNCIIISLINFHASILAYIQKYCNAYFNRI